MNREKIAPDDQYGKVIVREGVSNLGDIKKENVLIFEGDICTICM